MVTRNPDIRKAGIAIGRHLLPHSKLRDQQFWNENWPLIREILSLKAVLNERWYFFERDRRRNEAWSLITVVDLCWQAVRTLSDQSGSDRKLLQKLLPNNHRELFPLGGPLNFASIEAAVENITWAYSLNSTLRHPGTNAETIAMMLSDPWPEAQSQKLLDAADAISSIMSVFNAHLVVENGFEGDIAQKRALALAADQYRRVQN